MPTAVDCPNCGAPLKVEGDARVVDCAYCQRQLVVPKSAAQTEPRRSEGRRGGTRAAREQRAKLLFGLVAAGILAAGAIGIWIVLRTSEPKAAAAPGDQILNRLELSDSSEQVKALFGELYRQGAGSNVSVDFREGSVRRVEIDRDLPGGRISKITLYPRGNDSSPLVARLEQVVPNRIRRGPASHRLHVGDVVLDVFGSHISVWHWSSVHGARTDFAGCERRTVCEPASGA